MDPYWTAKLSPYSGGYTVGTSTQGQRASGYREKDASFPGGRSNLHWISVNACPVSRVSSTMAVFRTQPAGNSIKTTEQLLTEMKWLCRLASVAVRGLARGRLLKLSVPLFLFVVLNGANKALYVLDIIQCHVLLKLHSTQVEKDFPSTTAVTNSRMRKLTCIVVVV